MSNTNLNPETTVFTKESCRKQLEVLYKHLGKDAKKHVEATLKKIMEQNK